MNKKLFLLCPDKQLEQFIIQNYGNDVLFLTALGCVFNFEQEHYSEMITYMIEQEGISEIVIVNDTSCRFIKSVIDGGEGYGTFAEQVIMELLVDHFPFVMTRQSVTEQMKVLALLNVERQANEIFTNELFLKSIKQNNIRIIGLITTKAEDRLKEFELSNIAAISERYQ